MTTLPSAHKTPFGLEQGGPSQRVALSQLCQSLLRVDRKRAEPWVAAAHFWANPTAQVTPGKRSKNESPKTVRLTLEPAGGAFAARVGDAGGAELRPRGRCVEPCGRGNP